MPHSYHVSQQSSMRAGSTRRYICFVGRKSKTWRRSILSYTIAPAKMTRTYVSNVVICSARTCFLAWMNSNDPTTGQHDNDHDIGTVLITHHVCPAPVIPRDSLKIFDTVVANRTPMVGSMLNYSSGSVECLARWFFLTHWFSYEYARVVFG